MTRCLNCMKEYEEKYDVCPHCGFTPGTKPKLIYHLEPGNILANRYVVGTVVGSGGFGIVYRAWDKNLDKLVAIKEYYPVSIVSRIQGAKAVYVHSNKQEEEYQTGLNRFLEEARNMARFSSHLNIVNVYNFFEENNTAYCVMEFMNGISYKEYIRQHDGVIEEETAIKVTCAVLDALSDIHKVGIVHRDISPDNVMILDSGVIKLMDFGAARFSKGDKDEVLTIILKMGYAPPEQYKSKSKQGPFTDIYAVGAMLYYAVTGVRPDESINRIKEDCLTPPKKLNPNISDNLNNAILRAMAVLPGLRFQNAEEFKDALKSRKKTLDAEQELKKRMKRRKKGIAVALVLGVLGLCIGALSYDSKRAETMLKPAELELWVSAAPEDESGIQTLYEEIVQGFTTAYPQVALHVKVISEEEYSDRILEASKNGSMPDIYDSTTLENALLTSAVSLDKVYKRLDLNEYYILADYINETNKTVKFPVSFERPVVYVNTVLANPEELSAEVLTEQEIYSDELLDDFLSNNRSYLVSDTSNYRKINEKLAGRYALLQVPGGIQKNTTLAISFSVNKNSSNVERNAAYQFLTYLLSENTQYLLCIRHYENINKSLGLPINKSAYKIYVDVNGEFSELSSEKLPALKQ